MRVPPHHLCGFMPGDGLHGHHGDGPLAEPAGGLMAQIMEGPAPDPGFLQGFRVAGPHAVVGVPPVGLQKTASPAETSLISRLDEYPGRSLPCVVLLASGLDVTSYCTANAISQNRCYILARSGSPGLCAGRSYPALRSGSFSANRPGFGCS